MGIPIRQAVFTQKIKPQEPILKRYLGILVIMAVNNNNNNITAFWGVKSCSLVYIFQS
jgi:hypothetical protein